MSLGRIFPHVPPQAGSAAVVSGRPQPLEALSTPCTEGYREDCLGMGGDPQNMAVFSWG